MEATKRKRLSAAGWRVGTAKEFLGMSAAEVAFVEIKLRLAAHVRTARQRQRLTQGALARRLGSSQSRVAKVETADPSVSLDLLVRTLIALGTTPRDLGRILSARQRIKAA